MLFFLAFGWIKWGLPGNHLSHLAWPRHISNNKGVTYPTSIVWTQGTSKSNGLSSFSLFGCLINFGLYILSFSDRTESYIWLVVWNMTFLTFPSYWEWNNHPN
jgi:hypothetical protein